jgi:beta-glucanase (GH16 family)
MSKLAFRPASFLSRGPVALLPVVLLLSLAASVMAGCADDTRSEVESTVSAVSAGPTGLAINAGGPAVAPFIADADFTGGTTINHANAIDLSHVTSPAPAGVYQTARTGNVTYTIPGFTPASVNTIRLHFAETYFTAAGARVFNVKINGAAALTSFDVFQAAGAKNRAYVAEFSKPANASGAYVIQLVNSVNQALISGIQIVAASSACGTGIAGIAGHPDSTIAYPTYAGFTLALAEEFNCPLDLDADPNWTWSDGGEPEGQVRYQKAGLTFANGKMIVTVAKPAGGVPAGTSFSEPNLNSNTGTQPARALSGGELRAKYNNFRYGRYEARFKAPSANPGHELDPATSGNFLSTLALFRTPRWQEWNEIDVQLEANIPTKLASNVVRANGAVGYPAGNAAPATSAAIANFKIIDPHTYAVEWTPTKISWFVDGAKLREFTGTAAVPIPTLSAKVMFNLWVFASAAAFGDPANNKYPFTAELDYFRFYRWNQEATYPCSPQPSCLPATDTDFSKNNANETTYP